MATLFGEITIVDNGGTRAAIRSSKSNLAARRCSQQPLIYPPRRTNTSGASVLWFMALYNCTCEMAKYKQI